MSAKIANNWYRSKLANAAHGDSPSQTGALRDEETAFEKDGATSTGVAAIPGVFNKLE